VCGEYVGSRGYFENMKSPLRLHREFEPSSTALHNALKIGRQALSQWQTEEDSQKYRQDYLWYQLEMPSGTDTIGSVFGLYVVVG
jgi:hypothetical protein